MPRLVIRAQNVGCYPAPFQLFGYQQVRGVWRLDPALKIVALESTPPGGYYRYDDEVNLVVPAHELRFESPPGSVGRFVIETIRWGEHLMAQPIIMRNPVGMANPHPAWASGKAHSR